MNTAEADKVEAIKRKFAEYEADMKPSTRQIVLALADNIKRLREKDVSFKEILTIICEGDADFKLSEVQLKKYYFEVYPEPKRGRRKKQEETAAKADASTSNDAAKADASVSNDAAKADASAEVTVPASENNVEA